MNFCIGLKNKNADKNLTIDNVFSVLPGVKMLNKGLFEFLQAEQTFVKPYFDYDPEFDVEQTPIEINNFINMKKDLLCSFFGNIIKDSICVYGSQRRITKTNNPEKFKLSLHFIIDEHYISRENLQTIVKKIKKYEVSTNVKPIDCSVYSHTKQKFRTIYCVKDGLSFDTILYPWVDYQFNTTEDEDIFKKSLIQNFNTERDTLLEEIEYDDEFDEGIIYENNTEQNENTNDKVDKWSEEDLVELANIIEIKYLEEHDHAKRIVWGLWNSELTKDAIIEIMSKSSIHSNEEAREWVEELLKSDITEVKLGTIHYYAEQSNSILYKQFIEKRNNELLKLNQIRNCNTSDASISQILFDKNCGDFVTDSAKPDADWYYFNGVRWVNDVGNGMIMRKVTELGELFDREVNLIKNEIICNNNGSVVDIDTNKTLVNPLAIKARTLSKLAIELGNMKKIVPVIKYSVRAFADDKFLDKIDTNIDLLGFDNGVYDFKINKFREGKKEDYVTLSVGYNYKEQIDYEIRDVVIDFFSKIHPDIEIRTYYLKMLAKQLRGDDGKNLVHFHTGVGSNGKSKIFDLFTLILGDYITTFDVGILMNDKHKGTSSAEPEKGSWRGKRILFCSEPEEHEKIQTAKLKVMTGGDAIKYRNLYSNTYHTFTGQYKMHILCNNLPEINGNDTGIRRRIRTIPYQSRFVDKDLVDIEKNWFEVDTSILSKFKDVNFKMEVMRYILEHYEKEWSYTAPNIISKATNEYISECDALSTFLNETFVKDDKSFITLKQIKELIKSSEYKTKIPLGHTLKVNIERELGITIEKQKRINGKVFNGVFWGFKDVVSYNVIETDGDAEEL